MKWNTVEGGVEEGGARQDLIGPWMKVDSKAQTSWRALLYTVEAPPPPSVGILGREHNLAVDANYSHSNQICFRVMKTS
jgi:hypothetical protein